MYNLFELDLLAYLIQTFNLFSVLYKLAVLAITFYLYKNLWLKPNPASIHLLDCSFKIVPFV
jgi:hypothetical protein